MLQGLILVEPVLFNIFINNLDGETPCFADIAKLGVIDGSNGLCCHSGGPQQAGEMSQQESNEAPQRSAKVMGGITSLISRHWRPTGWKAALQKTGWLSWY